MDFTDTLARVRSIFRREPWWAEFWSSLTVMSWAAMSYASPQTMESWPSMAFLLRLGDDRFWHLAGLGLGAAQIVGLLGDWRWLRWLASVAMCWFWALLTLGVWISVPWAPGVMVYGGWCGINVFSILRLLRHHG